MCNIILISIARPDLTWGAVNVFGTNMVLQFFWCLWISSNGQSIKIRKYLVWSVSSCVVFTLCPWCFSAPNVAAYHWWIQGARHARAPSRCNFFFQFHAVLGGKIANKLGFGVGPPWSRKSWIRYWSLHDTRCFKKIRALKFCQNRTICWQDLWFCDCRWGWGERRDEWGSEAATSDGQETHHHHSPGKRHVQWDAAKTTPG